MILLEPPPSPNIEENSAFKFIWKIPFCPVGFGLLTPPHTCIFKMSKIDSLFNYDDFVSEYFSVIRINWNVMQSSSYHPWVCDHHTVRQAAGSMDITGYVVCHTPGQSQILGTGHSRPVCCLTEGGIHIFHIALHCCCSISKDIWSL